MCIYPFTFLLFQLPSKLMVPLFGGMGETNKVKYAMHIII